MRRGAPTVKPSIRTGRPGSGATTDDEPSRRRAATTLLRSKDRTRRFWRDGAVPATERARSAGGAGQMAEPGRKVETFECSSVARPLGRQPSYGPLELPILRRAARSEIGGEPVPDLLPAVNGSFDPIVRPINGEEGVSRIGIGVELVGLVVLAAG